MPWGKGPDEFMRFLVEKGLVNPPAVNQAPPYVPPPLPMSTIPYATIPNPSPMPQYESGSQYRVRGVEGQQNRAYVEPYVPPPPPQYPGPVRSGYSDPTARYRREQAGGLPAPIVNGVPYPNWDTLSPEQQIIISQSFTETTVDPAGDFLGIDKVVEPAADIVSEIPGAVASIPVLGAPPGGPGMRGTTRTVGDVTVDVAKPAIDVLSIPEQKWYDMQINAAIEMSENGGDMPTWAKVFYGDVPGQSYLPAASPGFGAIENVKEKLFLPSYLQDHPEDLLVVQQLVANAEANGQDPTKAVAAWWEDKQGFLTSLLGRGVNDPLNALGVLGAMGRGISVAAREQRALTGVSRANTATELAGGVMSAADNLINAPWRLAEPAEKAISRIVQSLPGARQVTGYMGTPSPTAARHIAESELETVMGSAGRIDPDITQYQTPPQPPYGPGNPGPSTIPNPGGMGPGGVGPTGYPTPGRPIPGVSPVIQNPANPNLPSVMATPPGVGGFGSATTAQLQAQANAIAQQIDVLDPNANVELLRQFDAINAELADRAAGNPGASLDMGRPAIEGAPISPSPITASRALAPGEVTPQLLPGPSNAVRAQNDIRAAQTATGQTSTQVPMNGAYQPPLAMGVPPSGIVPSAGPVTQPGVMTQPPLIETVIPEMTAGGARVVPGQSPGPTVIPERELTTVVPGQPLAPVTPVESLVDDVPITPLKTPAQVVRESGVDPAAVAAAAPNEAVTTLLSPTPSPIYQSDVLPSGMFMEGIPEGHVYRSANAVTESGWALTQNPNRIGAPSGIQFYKEQVGTQFSDKAPKIDALIEPWTRNFYEPNSNAVNNMKWDRPRMNRTLQPVLESELMVKYRIAARTEGVPTDGLEWRMRKELESKPDWEYERLMFRYMFERNPATAAVSKVGKFKTVEDAAFGKGIFRRADEKIPADMTIEQAAAALWRYEYAEQMRVFIHATDAQLDEMLNLHGVTPPPTPLPELQQVATPTVDDLMTRGQQISTYEDGTTSTIVPPDSADYVAMMRMDVDALPPAIRSEIDRELGPWVQARYQNFDLKPRTVQLLTDLEYGARLRVATIKATRGMPEYNGIGATKPFFDMDANELGAFTNGQRLGDETNIKRAILGDEGDYSGAIHELSQPIEKSIPHQKGMLYAKEQKTTLIAEPRIRNTPPGVNDELDPSFYLHQRQFELYRNINAVRAMIHNAPEAAIKVADNFNRPLVRGDWIVDRAAPMKGGEFGIQAYNPLTGQRGPGPYKPVKVNETRIRKYIDAFPETADDGGNWLNAMECFL